MSIEFFGSDEPSLGVEIEMQLIDPATRDLTQKSIEFLNSCNRRGISNVKAEFTQSMIEFDSGKTYSVAECRNILGRKIEELKSVSNEVGVNLCLAGTHPFQRWSDRHIYPDQRYLYFQDKFRWLAKRLTVHGLHVHVGVESGEKAIALSNHLIGYLPYLLALSASSPYWQGTDTGLYSCRSGIMRSLPISGVPYFFVDWEEYQKCCEMLISSGAIESLKDLHWFIRPNPELGTLEFRICDIPQTFDETMSLVALSQCLIVYLSDEIDRGVRPKQIRMNRYWRAPENVWMAARDGLNGMVIRNDEGERVQISDAVSNLVDRLMPVAEDLKCVDELLGIKEILKHGPGALRQRSIYTEKQSYEAVVDSLIEEFNENKVSTCPTKVSSTFYQEAIM